MPEEVILAIALVDLPFDIDSKDEIQTIRDGFGGSWWYLACECDDHYSDIVQEIVLLCSFQQIRELCFMKGGSSNQTDTVLSRATPKCKDILTHALRFLGRFEFVGSTPVRAEPDIGMKEFEALDFAYTHANEEGRRVLLRCFATIGPYKDAVSDHLKSHAENCSFIDSGFNFIFADGYFAGISIRFLIYGGSSCIWRRWRRR